MVCGVAAGKADTLERHEQSCRTSIKRVNYVLIGVVVGMCQAVSFGAAADCVCTATVCK